MNNADLLSPWICEASCFAATYAFSTVPYFSLDEPRNVTIVYNGDQASPRPFIFADVNGADGTGVNINQFTMSATVNGAAVTFTTGSTLLTFQGSLGPARLIGQFDASSLGTNVYPLVITVKAFYADGTTIPKTINTELMVLNEGNAPVAKGWTVVGVQRIYSTAVSGGYLITGGDGSGVRFGALGVKGADYSRVTYDSPSATYTRTYPDGSRAIFNSSGAETTFIDPNGRVSTFEYDAYGRVQKISDPYRKQPDGTPSKTILSYDANGLTKIQEPSADGTSGGGRATNFSVNSSRCLLTAQDPDGYSTGFSCDGSGRLYTVTDRRGGVTTFGYSPVSWKLSQVTLPQVAVDAGGGGTTLTNPVVHYNPWQQSGGAASIQDPKGRTTYFTVNAFGQAVDVTDPSGLHTKTTTNGILPTRITHPNGRTDTLVYDTLGRVTHAHPAGGSPTDYLFIPSNTLSPSAIGISGGGSTPMSVYLNANRQVFRIAFNGNPHQAINYTFDPQTLRLASSTDSAGHRVSYSYDSRLGNLAADTAPGARVTTRIIDGIGRDSVVSVPGMAPQTTLYDLMNRTASTSAGGTTISLGYDQLFQTDLYDANGNHYHTDYSALGWPINQCDAFAACSTTRYDASGLVMSTTNRRGQLISITRDNLGRLTSLTGTGLTPSYYSYSSNARDMVAWNAIERDSIFSNPGTIGFPGAPATDSVVTWIEGNKRYRIFHQYPRDTAGVDSVNITSNTGTTFNPRVATYWSSGILKAFKIGSTTIPFTPDLDGTGGMFGYPNFNRTSAALSTHLTGSVHFSNGLEGSFQHSYHYDLADRIDQMTIGNANTQQVFSYDGLGRLSGRDVRTTCTSLGNDPASGESFSCPTLVSSDVFTYDAMGNRTDHGGVPTTGNRYVVLNGGSYYYDADGNVIQKYKDQIYNRQFYWNAQNQLDSAIYNGWSRTDYDYNAFGKPVRVWDADPNGRHVARYLLWDGDALLAELTPSGQREVDYVYLPGSVDHPFAHTLGATSPTEVRYHELDQLGDVVGTSASGGVSQNNAYDAWGSLTYGGNADQHLTWKGLWYNGDLTGLYYVRNRWYDPEAGRFVNEDPAGFVGGVNLYAYDGNDPINGSDPSGLAMQAPCKQGDIAAAVAAMSASEGSFAWSCANLGSVTIWGELPGAPEPPIPQMHGGDTNVPHGGAGGGGGGKTASKINWAACGVATGNLAFTGASDALGLAALRDAVFLAKIGVDVGEMYLEKLAFRQAGVIGKRRFAAVGLPLRQSTLGIFGAAGYQVSEFFKGMGPVGELGNAQGDLSFADFIPIVATGRAAIKWGNACVLGKE